MRLAVKRTWVSSADHVRLRQSIDSEDTFMTMPNVVAVRQGRRDVPEWMSDENGGVDTQKVRQFLSKKFPFASKFNPKCNCFRCQHPTRSRIPRANCEQGCRECRETVLMTKWWTVIMDAYGARKTANDIELTNLWKPGTVGYIIQQINRAAAGLRLDGKPRTGRPRGRPKTQMALAA